MRFFIDTAKVEDIKKANDMGIICGVTTNPSLIAKEGRDFKEVIKEITEIVATHSRVDWTNNKTIHDRISQDIDDLFYEYEKTYRIFNSAYRE